MIQGETITSYGITNDKGQWVKMQGKKDIGRWDHSFSDCSLTNELESVEHMFKIVKETDWLPDADSAKTAYIAQFELRRTA
jgi:hypothetical protein